MIERIAFWPVLIVAMATVSMAMLQELPEGEGKKLLEEWRTSCDSLKSVVSLNQSSDSWKELILRMWGYGPQLDNKEVNVATEYLTKHFGPKSSGVVSLEEKTAERYIHGICSSCQRVPPRRAPSRVLKSSLELCIACPWQLKQFCSSIGSLVNSPSCYASRANRIEALLKRKRSGVSFV